MDFRMNLHGMILKSITTCIGKWEDFSYEVCTIVVEVVDDIFRVLMQELILELKIYSETVKLLLLCYANS